MPNQRDIRTFISRILKGKASPEDVDVANRWYGSEDNNIAPLPKEDKEVIKARILNNLQKDIYRDKTKIRNRNLAWSMRIAATLAFIAICTYVALTTKVSEVPEEAAVAWIGHTTPDGKRSQFVLPDNSRVWLNAGSTLEHPRNFNGDKREIILTGEAFFEVTHDKSKPFSVKTGEITTTVHGTSFNVRAYRRDVEVTVATGKVSVGKNESELFLTPGQQANYNPSNDSFSKKEVSVASYVVWKEKNLVFNGTDLETAMLMLERYYNVQITIKNGAIKDRAIIGEHRVKSLENAFIAMQHFIDFKYSFTEDGNVVIE